MVLGLSIRLPEKLFIYSRYLNTKMVGSKLSAREKLPPGESLGGGFCF